MSFQNAPSNHRKGGQSISFARGTKRSDGNVAVDGAARISTGSAYEGFAGMMDDYSASESGDSDDEEGSRPTPSGSRKAAPPGPTSQRDSWGARALAVGERPPDSRSQNPPTLKLLGLKSQREGGAPIGRGAGMTPQRNNFPLSPIAASPISTTASPVANPIGQGSSRPAYQTPAPIASALRDNPPQRKGAQEHSVSDYGDNSSRVGSTIDFGGVVAGHGSDGFGGRYGRVSAVPAVGPVSQSPVRPAEPANQIRLNDPQASRHALTAQLGLNTPVPSPRPLPGGQSSNDSPRDYFSARGGQGVPLERTQTGSSGSQSSQGHPRVPENAMVRIVSNSSGPPSPPVDPFGGGAPGRALLPTPSSNSPPRAVLPPGARTAYGIRAGATHQGNGPPPPQPVMMDDDFRRPLPGSGPGPKPAGFSDSAGAQQKRQSIFRRSLALVSGGGANEQAPPGQGGHARKPSLLRRSMNLWSGKKLAPPPPQEAELQVASPAPTVRTFDKKDIEKPKISYMGGDDSGDEWDSSGRGAVFWTRFNVARAHADIGDKSEQTSRSIRARVYYQQRATKWLAGLGGLIIIAGVIAVIVWREMSSSTTSSTPGAVQKGNYGGTTTPPVRRSVFQTIAAVADMADYQRSNDESLWAATAVRRAIEPSQPTAVARAVAPEEISTRLRKVRRHGQIRQAVEQA